MRHVWKERPDTALVIAGNPTAHTAEIEARHRRPSRPRSGSGSISSRACPRRRSGPSTGPPTSSSRSRRSSRSGSSISRPGGSSCRSSAAGAGPRPALIEEMRDGLLVHDGNPIELAGRDRRAARRRRGAGGHGRGRATGRSSSSINGTASSTVGKRSIMTSAENDPRLERNPDFRLESAGGGARLRPRLGIPGRDRPPGQARLGRPARAGRPRSRPRSRASLASRSTLSDVFIDVMRRAGLVGCGGNAGPEIGACPRSTGGAERSAPRAPASSRSSSRPTTAWTISTPASARSPARRTPTSRSSPWTTLRPTGRSSGSARPIRRSRSSPSAGTCTTRAG